MAAFVDSKMSWLLNICTYFRQEPRNHPSIIYSANVLKIDKKPTPKPHMFLNTFLDVPQCLLWYMYMWIKFLDTTLMKSHACVYEALVFWKLCAEVLSCFDLLIAYCLKYQLKMFLFCGEIKILSKGPLLGSLSLWTRRVQNRVTHARGTWRLGFLQSHPRDRPGKSPWTAS